LYVAGDIKMKKSPTLFPEDPEKNIMVGNIYEA
jgi:hypothetical protein